MPRLHVVSNEPIKQTDVGVKPVHCVSVTTLATVKTDILDILDLMLPTVLP